MSPHLPCSLWSCCLDPKTASIINSLAHLSPLVPTFITEVEYQFLWAIEGFELSNEFVRVFNYTYGLTYAEIPIPPLDEVPVYLFDVVFWAFVKVAYDAGEFDCPTPCTYLTFTS